jgi:DNA-binding IclR family transcriptional regulator
LRTNTRTQPHDLIQATITTPEALVTEPDKVRQQAYAMNGEEMAVGLRSVAAPMRGAMGQVVAAINISSDRVSRQELEAVPAPMVMVCAAGDRCTRRRWPGLTDTSDRKEDVFMQ